MKDKGQQLSSASIYHLGIQLLNLLERIHTAGYIFNDLKPDNILLGFNSRVKRPQNTSDGHNIFEGCSIHIVDFGFSSEYVNKETGEHLEQNEVKTFKGNLIFASLSKLRFQMASRRDDMLSLGFFLIYLLNNLYLPGINF